ncbi:methyl-cpg-binding domain-containing protein 9, partial [Phtheirospermum japonicum]
VLLCDNCDVEYHTYCLTPLLHRVPKGNWFCPCCAVDKDVEDVSPVATTSICEKRKKKNGEFVSFIISLTADLEAMVRGKDYWELFVNKTLPLKFLCDEMLDSTLLQEE